LEKPAFFICRLEESFSLLFYPENGGSRFLGNNGNDLKDYTASYPRRQ
jgi:hypothetical protein